MNRFIHRTVQLGEIVVAELDRAADYSLSVSRAIAVGVLICLTATAKGESADSSRPGSLIVAPGASLELDGDSTFHRFTVKAHDMKADVGMDAPRAAEAGAASGVEAMIRRHDIKTFELMVPVDKMSSGEGTLDEKMRKALKEGQYKQIRFQMDSYDASATSTSNGKFDVVLHGRLTLAGVERRIDVSAAGDRVGNGIRLSGSKDLLMTDYQITPPTMMFGTIKTRNLITVKFNATLQKESKS